MQEFPEFPIEESLSDKLAWLEFHFETLDRSFSSMESVCSKAVDEPVSPFLEIPSDTDLLLDHEVSFASLSTSQETLISDESLLNDIFQEDALEEVPKKPMVNEMIIRLSPPLSPNHLVGTITLQERQQKIKKYLEKRRKRRFSKRIHYDCRKRVADQRIRIKGRFITKEQAYALISPS